jgi:hypothetical protein
MVKFGDPNMEIKRDDPDRRKNFRARHQCDTNPGPKWKARYWSCRMWEGGKSVTQVTKGSVIETSEASEELFDLADLLNQNPNLSTAAEIETENEEMIDYQEEAVDMAYQNLSTIKRKAEQLMAMIDSNPEAAMEITEPWVAAKITVIDDYIGTVHDYLSSESTED